MNRKKKTLLDKLIEKKFGHDPLIEDPVKDKAQPFDKRRAKEGPPKENPVERPKLK